MTLRTSARNVASGGSFRFQLKAVHVPSTFSCAPKCLKLLGTTLPRQRRTKASSFAPAFRRCFVGRCSFSH